LKTSRRLKNFAEVSKSNCTSKTKLHPKNLANLNPRKHGFVPICAVSALELHALSLYPGNRQNDRNTNRLPYAFAAHAAHAHPGITSCLFQTKTLYTVKTD